MTRDELLTILLVERFGPDAARARPAGSYVCCDPYCDCPELRRRRVRQQVIDDLPPDSRPHTAVIVQAARP